METLMSAWAAFVAFNATPIGGNAITGFWVAFSGDFFLFWKAEGWTLKGWDWRVGTKRWAAGFVLGAAKGAGLG